MFGYTIIREKKLDQLYRKCADIAVENGQLREQIEELREILKFLIG